MKTNLGILISGGGTNLQAIIDACEKGILKNIAEVAVVISNKADAFGLERAKKHNIPAIFVDRKKFSDGHLFCLKIVEELKKHEIGLVCLAGFLLKLDPCFINAYRGEIINIHPALLPKYGGKGMYGRRVHEAVIASCEKESGATVHFVDEEFDHGKAILQKKAPILHGDTCETLAKRVLEVEHEIYPQAILKIIKG